MHIYNYDNVRIAIDKQDIAIDFLDITQAQCIFFILQPLSHIQYIHSALTA